MKKIYTLLLMFFLITINKVYSQTTYTWTAATNTNANVAANWNPSTGIPGANSLDNVVFDGSATADCNWNIASINSFSVLSGYTGNIDMGTGGRIINGNLVINSGNVLATTSDLEFLGTGSSNFVLSGSGVFNDNNSNINVSVQSGQVFTFSGNIVLNQLTIIGASNSSREINFGSNLSVENLIMDVGARIHSYQGTVHIKTTLDMSNLGNVAYTTVPSNNTANFIFDGTNALIEGVSNSTRGPLPNIEINTTGTYTITNNLNVRGNWTGTQGTLTAGTSIVNMYGSSAAITGTAAAFDNLTSQTGASVSFPSSAEVLVNKNLTNNGAMTFASTSTLGLNGSTSQTISGTAISVGGIHASSGTRNIVLNTAVSILDFLKVDANVTFASAGNLTLKSNSSLTARVDQLPTGASVTGNVIVETFVPGTTTGWANLGVRGVAGQLISSWDTYSTSAGANGLPMTCVGCAYSPTVIGTGSNSFVSVQDYNETTNLYTELISTDPINPGIGHWVYVGDGAIVTNNLITINTGTLEQGNGSIPVSFGAGAGFNLISNPYACPISWSALLAVSPNNIGFNDAIYVWNADLNTGSGGFTSRSGGLTTPAATGSIGDVIPAGQGFYIESLGVFPTLDYDESIKVTGNTSATPLLKEAATNSLGQFFRLKLKGALDWDETVIRVHTNATQSYDSRLDAHKIFQSPGYAGYPGPYSKYTTISSKDALNTDYSINSLPALTNSVSVPVLGRVSASGTYTISAFDFQDFDMCVGLIDKLDNSYHDLRANAYVCTINDTSSTPRFELILCKDESLNMVGVNEENVSSAIFINQDEQGPYVKTAFTQNTKAVISAYNVIGQKIMKDVTVEGTNTTTALNIDVHNQVILIKVTTDKESTAKKLVAH